MLSPSGLPEVPCPRCGERVAGLPWGELCPDCRRERRRRANRLASRISIAITLLVGLYVALQTPPVPMARVYGAVAVLTTYIVMWRIVQKVAMEFLPQ
jgi:hypothetical protein